MEALELTYGVSLQVWDQDPIVTSMMHLHNMLVRTGYLETPVGLFSALGLIYKKEFFNEGTVPESRFFHALKAAIDKFNDVRGNRTRDANLKVLRRSGSDLHEYLDTNINHIFKTKSLARLFREAYYIPDRITDDEIPLSSVIAPIRLSLVKRVTDPVTGKRVLQNTVLVQRFKEAGWDDDELLGLATNNEAVIAYHEKQENGIPSRTSEADHPQPKSGPKISPLRDKGSLSNQTFLQLLEKDLKSDVCVGARPILGLNYVWVTGYVYILFNSFEEKLRAQRHPLWVKAYENSESLTNNKKLYLILLALRNEDAACLRIMAECLDQNRMG
ncbi:hypothetical protein BJX70DRAFT_124507 [Aspergillus crustosus]